MLEIHKNYLFDEKQEIIAVQIPIEEFKVIEEALENYGLSKMIDETATEERLDFDDAVKYYKDIVKYDVNNNEYSHCSEFTAQSDA